ncbi:MAG: hypothetical protein WD066_04460 [Planctomycetaceae bacterium]
MPIIIDDAFALLITWTTYGTWLPGDPRGHASNIIDEDRRYERRRGEFGAPYGSGDSHTLARASRLQNDSTVWLDRESAAVAAKAIVEACRERGWRIRRAALMANHAHVLIEDCGTDAGPVRRILKGVSQAKLSDHAGINRRWFTRGGSDRRKRGANAIATAMRYVENQKGFLVRVAETAIVEEWPPRDA